MSGSTVITQRGIHYELRLETPSISFVEGRGEQAYHAAAAERFTRMLAPFDGALERAIAALPLATLDHARWTAIVPAPDGVPWDVATLTLAADPLPDAARRAELAADVVRAIHAILIAHHARERDAARRGPATAGRFHYTRFPDGTIEDLNGEAPGIAPAVVDRAVAAAIVAAAAHDGVVHPQLDASHVRVDGETVSIDGYGAPFAPVRCRVDWLARQRAVFDAPSAAWRRGTSQIAARRALDVPGLLVPCIACGRPALRHVDRDLPAGPDCCWRDRERRDRFVIAAVLAVIALVIAWRAC